jgi:hypothetical protein
VSASSVCSTECLLGLLTIPLFAAAAINIHLLCSTWYLTETFFAFMRSYQ